MEDIVEPIYVDEDGAGILSLGGVEDISVWTRTEVWQSRSVAFRREPLYRPYIGVVVCYMRCDVAGTGKVVILMLHIGLAYYPEPEEGESTGQRYQNLSYKVMSHHHDLLTTTVVVKTSR